MTLSHCLREAWIAEDIAAQVSLDVHRDRMLEIARRWRERADLMQGAGARSVLADGAVPARTADRPAA